MKRLLLLSFLLVNCLVFGQASSQMNNALNTNTGLNPPNIVYTLAPPASTWQQTNVANLVIPIGQVNNLQTVLDAKQGLLTGTSLQYVKGDGTYGAYSPDQVITLTAGNRISITGTYPNFTIAFVEPSINPITSKTFNSNFTVSATKQATVSYSVTCSVTNPLLAGSSTANVYLEYSTNGGSTWSLPSQNGNASTVGVAVAIAITNGQTGTVTGVIPANALVRLRTATTGTATVTFVTGTEIY